MNRMHQNVQLPVENFHLHFFQLYFALFSPNTGKFGPEKNCVFGHFSHSEN